MRHMSKEMWVIVLGVWIIIATQLGVPGPWRTALVIASAAAIAILGFLLRGEALSRGKSHGTDHSFIENAPGAEHLRHDRKEGINSLN